MDHNWFEWKIVSTSLKTLLKKDLALERKIFVSTMLSNSFFFFQDILTPRGKWKEVLFMTKSARILKIKVPICNNLFKLAVQFSFHRFISTLIKKEILTLCSKFDKIARKERSYSKFQETTLYSFRIWWIGGMLRNGGFRRWTRRKEFSSVCFRYINNGQNICVSRTDWRRSIRTVLQLPTLP